MNQKEGLLTYPPPLSPPFSFPNYEQKSTPSSSSSSSSFSRISPILLWVIVTLAVIFFISGLIHLLIRYLIKKRSSFSIIYHSNRFPETSRSHSLQRQLHHLFRLHDSGLDQSSIDALPVFNYRAVIGLKDPFDCAVCLCEFSIEDKLRLLPTCGHAFHIDCIGTWLLSNTTCPLCRSSLLGSGLNEHHQQQQQHSGESSNRFVNIAGQVVMESGLSISQPQQQQEQGVVMEEGSDEKRVFSVRLGKLRSFGGREKGETSGGCGGGGGDDLGARRCYSMGSYQYVVGESNLVVSLPVVGGGLEGKRVIGGIGRARGGDSFSVSKVWLWPKRSKFSGSSSGHMWVPSNLSSSSRLSTDNMCNRSQLV